MVSDHSHIHFKECLCIICFLSFSTARHIMDNFFHNRRLTMSGNSTLGFHFVEDDLQNPITENHVRFKGKMYLVISEGSEKIVPCKRSTISYAVVPAA